MPEPLERLTNLLALLLETKQPLTLTQITAELGDLYPSNEVAARGMFERDKAMLRDVGVPIEQVVLGGNQAGQTAYWIDRRRYELADLDLTDEERHALQLAVATVRTDDQWGQEGLWKLGASGERPSRAVAATVPSFAALAPLREAVAARVTVDFEYRGVARRLDPYGLLLRDGYWYVIGHDHNHDEVRTFRVDRIEGSVSRRTGTTFERPDGFDLRTVFPADPRLLGEPGAQAARAVVRVDASRAALLASEVGDAAVLRRHADGSIDIEVPCVNRDAFRSWLMGLTEHAVVVSPADLCDEVVTWLRTIVATGSRAV